MRWILVSSLGLACVSCLAVRAHAQAPSSTASFERWEISLDGQVGFPTGFVKVTETNSPGTKLNLRGDLGIDVSEAVEASAAFHLTPRDAIRASFLYYFLEGSTTIDRPFTYNGEPFEPGRVHSNLDFSRLSLSYERRLMDFGDRASLTGSIGLTYVSLDAVVHGNHEDFYRQELPVPIA